MKPNIFIFLNISRERDYYGQANKLRQRGDTKYNNKRKMQKSCKENKKKITLK